MLLLSSGLLDTAEFQDPYSFKSQTDHWLPRKLQQGFTKRERERAQSGSLLWLKRLIARPAIPMIGAHSQKLGFEIDVQGARNRRWAHDSTS